MPDDSRASPYWDLDLTWVEILLLTSAVTLIFILHLEPILESRFALPLIVSLAAMCYLSPVTGFLFIACSQYLPFPEEALLNPSQIGFLVWLPVVLVRYSGIRLGGLWRLWPVLLCLSWYVLMTGEKLYLPGNNYLRALCYAVVACQLTNEARGQYLKCLFGLCLGAMLIMCAYWADHAGLPVELSDWGDIREGIARTGGTRADSVMVWPALLIGITGLLGLQFVLGSSRSPEPSPRWLTWLTATLGVLSLPVLVSTMTLGAIVAFGLLLLGIVALCARVLFLGAFTPQFIRHSVVFIVMMAALASVSYADDVFGMRTKIAAMAEYYKHESLEAGMFTSRNAVWRYSIRTILEHPVFGVVDSHEPEDIPPEYSDNPEGYVSHNVFLDFGRYSGILGMVLAAFFFLFPALKMARGDQWISYIPFLGTHFAMFIFWMSLSFVHYKTFWAFWMLASMAAGIWPNRNTLIRQKQPRTGRHGISANVSGSRKVELQ